MSITIVSTDLTRLDWDLPDCPVNLREFRFRRLTRADLPAVKELHDALFPVKYSDAFYEELLNEFHINILAFAPVCKMRSGGSATEDAVELVGIATATWEPVTGIGGCRRWHEGYISTLGVAEGYRQIGLGTFLVRSIVRLLIQFKRVRVVHLHVLVRAPQLCLSAGPEATITPLQVSNEPALRMYAKCGFVRTQYLPDHYHFGGRHHDAYLLTRTCTRDEISALSRVGTGATDQAKDAGWSALCVIL